jgi:nucleotide-binding universal stress UspA family protein
MQPRGDEISDNMMQKIMIATDGSDMSKKAVKSGIDIAHHAKGCIIAVYVIDISRLSHLPGYAMLPGLKDKVSELMKEEGRQATQFAADQAQMMNVPCRKIIAQGNPSQEIIKSAQEIEADLIVIGSRGRTGVEKFLLGSVAEKVVLQSSIPVLMIKGDEN